MKARINISMLGTPECAPRISYALDCMRADSFNDTEAAERLIQAIVTLYNSPMRRVQFYVNRMTGDRVDRILEPYTLLHGEITDYVFKRLSEEFRGNVCETEVYAGCLNRSEFGDTTFHVTGISVRNTLNYFDMIAGYA